MALGGTAVLSQVSVESPQVPKKLEGVNGRITFNADRAQVTGLTARAGSSSLALDASVTDRWRCSPSPAPPRHPT